MTWFTNDYLDFFKELAANNHRDWFQANKKRYEKNVKDPFHAFVAEVIGRAHKDDPGIQVNASAAIFRINRDVRFSQDKSPYKLHMSAVVSPGRRNDMESPGLYFEFGPEQVGIYGGSYMPARQQLDNIRQAIAQKPTAITKLIEAPAFKKLFDGKLLGEQNVRLPKELQKIREEQPLIANKQFYFMANLPAEEILREDLADLFMEYYMAAKPVNVFLRKASVFGES